MPTARFATATARASRRTADTATRSRKPTTIRSCRCCFRATAHCRSLGESRTSSRASAAGLRACGCPNAPPTTTRSPTSAAGIKFVILAPEQGVFSGEAVGRRGAGPFLWRSAAHTLAVFRFDRELSRAISFENGLTDGKALADSIAAAAGQVPPGGALLLATDGETFGHHKRRGDAEL